VFVFVFLDELNCVLLVLCISAVFSNTFSRIYNTSLSPTTSLSLSRSLTHTHTYPDIVEGAYAYPSTSHTYKRTEIQKIINFAKMRGIRVLVEFDTPGHTKSW